ncbi:MAG: AAA family ATPase [Microlunatus sp.]|nr:AAA family ATPase [Microlunatus sp.]
MARLRGRNTECGILDRLLDEVRAGRSQVLVVHGEPGVGKSALLSYCADTASDCRVVRVAGVQYETELAYAGLHQLCAPMLHLRDRLPGPQRNALETVFGLSARAPADRFLVGLAVLGLFAEFSEQQPLVCIIDDVQWLDSASALVVSFVARRLLAESVGLVLALSQPSEFGVFAGLPQLLLDGLTNGDARALLDSAWPGRLDERVRDRVIAEARGNPLAILELPRGMTTGEVAGGFERPDIGPAAARIEQSFLRQLEPLPATTRLLLLTAAAEPLGDVPLLWRAAYSLGLGAEAARPAQAAGLVDLGARVRFRHPLLRSAVYQAATMSERRTVHRALAAATDAEVDPDRRAWHLGYAAEGTDETVAAELETAAARAERRGGVAAAAEFLQRAAELTPDSARRGQRALAAAEAKLESGALEAAQQLLSTAEGYALSDVDRARLPHLRAQIVFTKRGIEAPPLLLEAAARLEPHDDAAAREIYLEAIGASIFAGRLCGPFGPRTAAVAAHMTAGARWTRAPDLLLDGLATRFTNGYVDGVPALRRALTAFEREPDGEEDDFARWLWLSWLVACDLWDDQHCHELATRAVLRCRELGALTVLPLALNYRATMHVFAGELAPAAELADEAEAITTATGYARAWFSTGLFAAWRGTEDEFHDRMDPNLREARERGEGRAIGLVGWFQAVLYNGLGRYDEALASAEEACSFEDLGFFGHALAELVEAAVRAGARSQAGEAFELLEERTAAVGSEWALGIQARSRALLSTGAAAEADYRDAIKRLTNSRITVELARAHLVYGEWLRRENHRADARVQLRTAYDMFHRFGTMGFAERARRELAALGDNPHSGSYDIHGVLTPQEAQIARMARDGLSNPEIGAQLYISRHTVEWHLRNVYTKLDIRSRRQLQRIPVSRLESPSTQRRGDGAHPRRPGRG